MASGDLGDARYSSYMKLEKESEYHEMSYEDQQRQDRAFGGFIKSPKRQMNEE